MKFVALALMVSMVACGGNSDVPADEADSSASDAASADVVVSHPADASAVLDAGQAADTGVQDSGTMSDASSDAGSDASHDSGTCHHKHHHECDHDGCH